MNDEELKVSITAEETGLDSVLASAASSIRNFSTASVGSLRSSMADLNKSTAQATTGMGNSFKQLTAGMKGVGSSFTTYGSQLSASAQTIKGGFQQMGQGASQAWTSISKDFGNIPTLTSNVTQGFNQMAGGVKLALSGASSAASSTSGFFSNLGSSLLEVGRGGWNLVANGAVVASNALTATGKVVEATGNGMQSFGGKISSLGSKLTGGASSFTLMGAAAGAMATVTSAAMSSFSSSITSAISRLDTFARAPKQFQQMGASAEESAKAMNMLDKSFEGMPVSLDKMAGSTTQVMAALQGSNNEAHRTVGYAADVSSAFENMGLASGSSSAAIDRAMIQFNQGLAKGKFGLQDFRSIVEVMPEGMSKMAQSLLGGKASAMDLYEAMKDGKVTMDDFTQAMQDNYKAGTAGAEAAREQSRTIGNGMEYVRTQLTKWIAAMITGETTMDGQVQAQKKLADMIYQVGDAMKGMTPQVAAFGRGLKEGFEGVVKAGGPAVSLISNLVKAIAGDNGGAEAFGKALGTIATSFVAMQIVGAILGPVGSLISTLGSGVSSVGNFAQGIGGLGKSIGEAIPNLGIMENGTFSLGKSFTSVGTIFGLVFNPMTALLAIVAAAFWALSPAVGGSMAQASDALQKGDISGALKAMGDAVGNVVKAFQAVDWNSIVQPIATAVGSLIDIFDETFNIKGKNDVDTSAQRIQTFGLLVVQALGAAGDIVSGFGVVLGGIATVLEAVVRGVIALGQAISGDLSGAAATLDENVSAKFTGMAAKSGEAFAQMYQDASQNLEDLKNNGIQKSADASTGITGNFDTAATGVNAATQNMLDGANGNTADMATNATANAESANKGITDNMNQAQTNASNAMATAAQNVNGSSDTIKQSATNGASGAKDGVAQNMGQLGNISAKGVGEYIGQVNAGQRPAAQAGTTLSASVKDNAKADLDGNGKGIMDSFLGGLQRGYRAVQTFVGGIASWIEKHKGPISYDKRLLIPAGRAIMNGLYGGLQDNWKAVQTLVGGMAGDIQSAFMDVDTPEYDLSGSFSAASSTLKSQVDTGVEITAQPAYVNLNLGGKDYRAFVDDISTQQGAAMLQRTV